MKKKLLYIFGATLLTTAACQKDKLTPVNQTSVIADSQNLQFSTTSRILAQVLGLYGGLRNGQLYGGRYIVYNDVKADNWINSTANSVTAYQTWTETVSSTSSEVLNLWSQAYFVINNCNLFIDGMASKGGTTVAGATLSAQYIAEAKFIRAITYYALLEMYCKPYVTGASSPGLPLRLAGNSDYGNYDLAPSTVSKVFDQVIADLNDAEAGLPSSYSDAATNTTRAHKNTAIAFKMRVYLAMQQYANVITEGAKIVSATAPYKAPTGVANTMQTTLANVYNTPYTTTESIFSMPFNTLETPGTQNGIATYFANQGGSEFYLNVNGVYGHTGWKSADARRAYIRTVTRSGVNYYYVIKMINTTPYDWTPLMRYPEVLLSLAEARVRSTNTIDLTAIALLNAVRNRSDATTVYTAASFATPDELSAAILEERNIEFLGEGLRWNDLWRLNLPIPAKSSVPQVNPTDNAYIWPMSGNEQQYNKLIGR